MYRRISALLFSILIAVAILGYMLSLIWGDLAASLARFQPFYLGIAVGICLCAWGLRGLRYRYILRSLEVSVTTVFSTACIFVSQTANLIVPARLGDFIRMLILRHENKASYSSSLSSLVVERVFDIVTVATLGVLSIPFILNVPSEFYLVIGIALAAGIGFFLVLIATQKSASENGRARQSENRYIVFFLNMLDEVRSASLNISSIVSFATLSFLIWLVDILVCVAVIRMFQLAIAFPLVLLAIVVGNLVKAVPITPGGYGTYEAAMAAILSLGGIAPDAAILVAVVDHLIKNLVTALGGLVSISYFGKWAVQLLKKALAKNLGGEGSVRD